MPAPGPDIHEKCRERIAELEHLIRGTSHIDLRDEAPELAGIHVAEFHSCVLNVDVGANKFMIEKLQDAWRQLENVRAEREEARALAEKYGPKVGDPVYPWAKSVAKREAIDDV